MPHQCTSCGRMFADGSKEMLAGCPDCGGNKFQFKPEGAPDDSAAGDDEEPQPDVAQDPGQQEFVDTDSVDAPQQDALSTGQAGEEKDAAPRNADQSEQQHLGEFVEQSRPPEQSQHPEQSQDEPAVADVAGRDDAATERDDTPGIDPEDATGDDPTTAPVTDPDDTPETDLSALRDELNDQFESIKITAPGQYELNLMELYDRKEFIISLQEDGRYVVDIPEGADHRD